MKKIGMELVEDNGIRNYPKTGEVAVERVYELYKLKEPAFKIVDYFEMSTEQQLEIQNQIEARQDLWGALSFVLNCLKKEGLPQVSPTDGGFHDLLGPGHLFLMLDENNAKDWSHAESYAKKDFNAEYTYISTDHIGLYEKYGYEFFTECSTVWGDNTRVLRKKL